MDIRRARGRDTAITHAIRGEWDLAVATNRALLEDYPSDIEAADRLGFALMQLGELDAAEAVYSRACELAPDDQDAQRGLRQVQQRLLAH